MEKQMVQDLRDKQVVDSVFLVNNKSLLTGKTGKSYISMGLCDRTGHIDARIWDDVERLACGFDSGDIVKVKGFVQVYQNRMQIIVQSVEKVEKSAVSLNDFICTSKVKPEKMLSELESIIKTIKNDHLRQLIFSITDDEQIRPLLLKSPAAKSIHHAWQGGLLEHVLTVVKISLAMADIYQSVSRDLLLAGAILHDMGKMWEIDSSDAYAYSDKGRMLGHIVLGCELVEKKASQILGFPEELKDLCKHMVISHHGKLEFGSPKTPVFVEGLLLSLIDDLDSKMATVCEFIEQERHSGDKWSRYSQMFDRYFYLKDFSEEDKE